MMRRLALLTVLLCAIFARSASANAFGQMIPAAPLMGGNNEFGIYTLFGDQVDNVGLLGQVRFSASPKFDWGLQAGFSDAGDGAVLVGGDIRPILRRSDPDFPLDLAFDGGIGLTIGDGYSVLQLVPAIEASHRFPLNGQPNMALSPYMSVGWDIHHTSIDGGNDDTSSDFVARFGLEWQAARKLAVMGEFGVGDPANDFILGVNVPF